MPTPLVSVVSIDAWLPQTQCARCGYPRCLPYAEAIARGEADINRCPPGGEVTINALAQLLGRPPVALDPACGDTTARVRAVIDEERCIGCTKCLPVCPVDAIIGGPKRMHTVVETLCTGCELCVAPCPVDCIALMRHPTRSDPWPEYTRTEAERFRQNAERHFARIHLPIPAKHRRHPPDLPDRARIRAEIADAVERVRRRRSGGS